VDAEPAGDVGQRRVVGLALVRRGFAVHGIHDYPKRGICTVRGRVRLSPTRASPTAGRGSRVKDEGRGWRGRPANEIRGYNWGGWRGWRGGFRLVTADATTMRGRRPQAERLRGGLQQLCLRMNGQDARSTITTERAGRPLHYAATSWAGICEGGDGVCDV
jgi:hypothetical protein